MIYFIAIDFETTGLSPNKGDSIVEIGAVKFDLDGNVLGSFSELANPGRSIPYQASRIHGITDRDVADCDPVATVWNRFLNWAGDFTALVAHNAGFERRFMQALYNGKMPHMELIDTLALARSTYHDVENHQLRTLCIRIGHKLTNAHRALPDAHATARLLTEIIRRNPTVISKFVPTVVPNPPKAPDPITGQRVLADGTVYYGDFTTGQLSGIGRCEWPDGRVYKGNFENGQMDGEGRYEWPDGTVCEGDFVDDGGQGSYIWPSGTVYEAYVMNGRRTGQGSYIWPDGKVYDGDFVNGDITGGGWCKEPDGRVYEGEFVDGQYDGEGRYEWPDGRVYEGQFVNGELDDQGLCELPDGRVYEGEVVNDELNGDGRCEWPDGRVYEGNFKNGEMDGEGRHQWPDGRVYEGEFVSGKSAGQGLYTWPDGTVYDGDFANRQMTGRGCYRFPNGGVYEGDVVNGLLSGRGRYTWPDGKVYEGDFVSGQQTGRGSFSWPNGEIYEGGVVNGLLSGRGRYEWPNGKVYEGDFAHNQIVLSDPELQREHQPKTKNLEPDSPKGDGHDRHAIGAGGERTIEPSEPSTEELRQRQKAVTQHRRQEIIARNDALLSAVFPSSDWLFNAVLFGSVLFSVWFIGELFANKSGDFFGAAFVIAVALTPLIKWRFRENAKRHIAYKSGLAERDAERQAIEKARGSQADARETDDVCANGNRTTANDDGPPANVNSGTPLSRVSQHTSVEEKYSSQDLTKVCRSEQTQCAVTLAKKLVEAAADVPLPKQSDRKALSKAPQNDTEAAKWYRLAADQGNADAQVSLGLMYEKGRGVPQSDIEAAEWYRLAADQGNADAQVNLGLMYDDGRGISQSDIDAVKWYRLAADQGNSAGQSNLGLMYEQGRGVPQNDVEAAKWFRLAAQQRSE